MITRNFIYFTTFCLLITGISACQTYEVAPKQDFNPTIPNINPFDDWSAPDTSIITDDLDTTSFLGVYARIFNPKCNNPACHDGTFEPDFRTPFSAFNTLVYASNIKNTVSEEYDYRVVPYDTESSWMHYRVTTDDAVLGRMPLYDTLADWQVNAISEWINNGAPDLVGNIANPADLQPFTVGYAAYIGDTNGVKIDTVREAINMPFEIPAGEDIQLWIGLFEEEGGDLPFQLTNRKIKLSVNPFDFSDAAEFPIESTTNPHIANNVFAPNIPFFLYANIPSSFFESGDIIYFRIEAQDSDHSFPTEIPKDGGNVFFMQHFSFKII